MADRRQMETMMLLRRREDRCTILRHRHCTVRVWSSDPDPVDGEMILDSTPRTLGRRLEGGTFYVCTGINLDSDQGGENGTTFGKKALDVQSPTATTHVNCKGCDNQMKQRW